MSVQTWETLPQAKFYINRLRGYTFFWKIYTKNYQFQRFWGDVSPHFKSDNGEIWREGTDLEHPPPPLDLGIHQRHKISSESLKGPAGIALPRGGDAY